MKNTIRLAILLPFVAIVACANPCKTLRDARDYGADAQTIIKAFCACAAANPTANAACMIEAPIYEFGNATLTSAINTFCTPGAKFPIVSPLQTRDDFGAWLRANGAARK